MFLFFCLNYCLNLLPQLSQIHKKAVFIPDEPADTQPEKFIFEQPADAQPEKSELEHEGEQSIFEQPPLLLQQQSSSQFTPGLFLKVRIFV
jgi:hypothetical protein